MFKYFGLCLVTGLMIISPVLAINIERTKESNNYKAKMELAHILLRQKLEQMNINRLIREIEKESRYNPDEREA